MDSFTYVPCPKCKHVFRVTEHFAAKCPKCGHHVPLSLLEPVPPDDDDPFSVK